MISHHDKCIFVHIPKCAGQSIETFFLERLGLSWEDRAVLLLRPNDRVSLGPPRLAHLLARDYVEKKWISPEIFSDYYKFTVVRNPWSRAVSLYRFLGQDKKISFSSFVKGQLSIGVNERQWFLRPQLDYVTESKGAVIVDFVARMETLGRDFSLISQALGIESGVLQKVNASGRPKTRLFNNPFIKSHDNWRKYYSADLVKIVGTLYECDIDNFGYAFD
jgi:hypothetical protein